MIIRNHQLKNFNTFGIEACTNAFISLKSESRLIELIEKGVIAGRKILVLGGGSNILFVNDFEGIIIHPEMYSIKVNNIKDGFAEISCEAGTEWDSFVDYCVENNYGGLENLSYIPGSVGAAPIQNIGAYGVEVKDCIESVRAVDLENGEIRIFGKEECNFAYRSSIFKTDLKGQFLITSVSFKLIHKPAEYNLSYGMLEDRVNSIGKPTLKSVRNAVIQIRKEKLPEPEIYGNAGSFFKNPLVSPGHFSELQSRYHEIPSYSTESEMIKVPAGWLIEKCGWKGYRKGEAGVHTRQALVLVNYGNATGKEILILSEEIIQSVCDKFGIKLQREVNVID